MTAGCVLLVDMHVSDTVAQSPWRSLLHESLAPENVVI